MKKTVCVLFGGKSLEHEVSLQSAASVCAHIPAHAFAVLAIGIDHDGCWHFQEEIRTRQDSARGAMLVLQPNPEPVSLIAGRGFFYRQKRLPVDVVFPVLHGTFGEDGTIQGLLDAIDLPYVGPGILGSSLPMDKEKTKRVWRDSGLPVVDFFAVSKHDFESSDARCREICRMAATTFAYPFFIKPSAAGSSVGVSKITREADIKPAFLHAFACDTNALVEKGVNAREIECAVIGNEEPRAFMPGEVIPSHGFYSYEAKYLDPEGAVLAIPAKISEATAQTAMDLAIKAYQSAGIEGLARVDLFLSTDDGSLWLNEVNTIPGFTNISMFPRMCEAGGLPYEKLITTLLELGMERQATRKKVSYQFTAAKNRASS